MNRLTAILAFSLVAGSAWAADPAEETLLKAGRLSVVPEAASLPADPGDSAWDKASSITLAAYPQRTTPPGLAEEKAQPFPVELRVLVRSGQIAFRLSWPDATENGWQMECTDSFADAAALQFATPGRDGILPYIGMGEPRRPVDLWFWRHGQGTERLGAHGFGTLEKVPTLAPEVRAHWKGGTWHAVFSGVLPAKAGPLPVAIALWDGADQGRDGRKRLTAWHLLRLPGLPEDPKGFAALAAEAGAKGNAERGKALASEHGCLGCHRLPGGEPVAAGPDLTLAGGLHWPGYLRRSLRDPSSFVVPLARYAEDGNLAADKSLMPPLELKSGDIEDIAAYLLSLR